MMDVFELARKVQSTDPEKAKKEIFDLLKSDPKSLTEIVKGYSEMILEDVLTIKEIVNTYHDTPSLQEKDLN